MKKKIVSITLAVALAAIAVIGGTMAYFTDKDAATNTFTVGNVEIDLTEPNWDEDENKLIPGTKLPKDPTVTNTGSEDAYVRIHYAIPAALVDPESNSYNDMVHVNFSAASAKNPYWSWQDQYTEGDGWTSNGLSANNVYFDEVGGEECMVWVVTYRTKLAADATTEYPAFFQVYLDQYTKATQDEEGVVTYTKPFFTDKQGGNVDPAKTMTYEVPEEGIKIHVIAEGAQAEGFANAFEALNTAFGVPGSYNAFAAN